MTLIILYWKTHTTLKIKTNRKYLIGLVRLIVLVAGCLILEGKTTT